MRVVVVVRDLVIARGQAERPSRGPAVQPNHLVTEIPGRRSRARAAARAPRPRPRHALHEADDEGTAGGRKIRRRRRRTATEARPAIASYSSSTASMARAQAVAPHHIDGTQATHGDGRMDTPAEAAGRDLPTPGSALQVLESAFHGHRGRQQGRRFIGVILVADEHKVEDARVDRGVHAFDLPVVRRRCTLPSSPSVPTTEQRMRPSSPSADAVKTSSWSAIGVASLNVSSTPSMSPRS